jgi:EpsI family protein
MIARAMTVMALLILTGLYAGRTGAAEVAVDRDPLASLPRAIGEWRGHDAAPLADDIVSQLGVDDYVNRQYVRPDGGPIGLYVGYYGSQRQGDTIHSPQNCLPGAGWHPIAADRATVHAAGAPFPVNRYVIQKGLDRQVVFYWYQGRGRRIANEYLNKMMLMVDAARLNRTNGGLVRLIAPVSSTPEAASGELTSFTAALVPLLSTHLP